ncbi:MAG: HGGxSTG domain-containing protein [Methyloceanibacter sp.]|uniref:HGGxSTG domain-containing protein n=1 Tax=Methyloceanibacter sp. TaxID=1965321 RepID=UPI003D9B71EF
MHLSPRCGAKTRQGTACRSPAMTNGRCRMHGGKSPGAPKGNRNAWKHGARVGSQPQKRLEHENEFNHQEEARAAGGQGVLALGRTGKFAPITDR